MSKVEELKAVYEAWGIEALYVFESRDAEIRDLLFELGKEGFWGASDVDIGVKFRPGFRASVKEKSRLAISLEGLLRVDRVDLCVIEEADPFVAVEVISGERLYCKNDVMENEYGLYVLRRAGDLAFLQRERMKLVLYE